jgi:hypothetical protein
MKRKYLCGYPEVRLVSKWALFWAATHVQLINIWYIFLKNWALSLALRLFQCFNGVAKDFNLICQGRYWSVTFICELEVAICVKVRVVLKKKIKQPVNIYSYDLPDNYV